MDIFAEKWRESNDYRKAFFSRNKGLFGKIYICSQCWKPLIRRKDVEVDHIVPPSRLLWGSQKNNLMATMMNTEMNTVAICGPCNRRKSNKMGFYVVKGWAARFVAKAITYAQDIAVFSAYLILLVAHYIIKFSSKILVFSGKTSFKGVKGGVKTVGKMKYGKIGLLVLFLVGAIVLATKYLK